MIRPGPLLLALVAAVSLAASAHAQVSYPRPLSKASAQSSYSSMVGQLFFSSGPGEYIGSGAVIRPSSILTAGHNLYDPKTGWSTNTEFRRAAYGQTALSAQYSSRMYLMSGYKKNVDRYGANDLRSFAHDVGGVRFNKTLANGNYALFSAKGSLISTRTQKEAIGYGAKAPHTGDYPLSVSTTTSFHASINSFYENNALTFEPGMSGGPVFCRDTNGQFYVVAVIVAISSNPAKPTGGVRPFGPLISKLVSTYLK